jgi:hypothetical protein
MLLRHISTRQIAPEPGTDASGSDLPLLEEESHVLERRQTVLYDVDAAKAKFLQRCACGCLVCGVHPASSEHKCWTLL